MRMQDIIKSRRLELRLTLEEVGNIVGVSKATVQRWENGDIANMRQDKIAKLAKALQVSPGYLMGWESAKKSPSAEELFGDDKEGLTIYKMYEDLPEDLKIEAKRYLSYLIAEAEKEK